MKSSVFKNYLYNITYQILAIIIPIVTTPYLSRVLEAEGLGISAYTISIITYFTLFGTLGISIYGQREIAYVQGDKIKRTEKFWELVILKAITMFVTIFIYLLYIRNNRYEIYFRILLIELLAVSIDISWFFQGMEDFKKTVGRNLIIKILSLISIFIFVKDASHVNVYLLIYGTATFFGNLSLWFGLRKYICKINIKNIKFISHLKPAIIFLIPQIANKLYTVIDKTMLGNMIYNIEETGYYDQAEKIVKIWITIITALGVVIMPRIANHFAKKEEDSIKRTMLKTINYVYFCAFPLVFGLIATAPNFVPIYLGDGFEKSKILIQIFAPIVLIIGLNNIIGNQYLLPTQQQNSYTKAVIIGTLINFLLNLLLIKLIGSYGAAIATIISEIIVLAIELYYVRKQFNILEWFKKIKNYLIASIIMFFVCCSLSNVSQNLILNCVVQVTAGILTYSIILIALKDEFLDDIIRRCKKIVKGVN